jgi:hypothetical protein
LAHCEFCGTKIGSLPFKCKYCGGIYCSKHRLPENHQCTFDLKPTPIVPSSIRGSQSAKPPQTIGRLRPVSDFETPPKVLKKYIERDQKHRKKARKIYERSLRRTTMRSPDTPATTFIVIAVITLSIVALFFPLELCLSVYGLSQYYFWTFFSSLFISYTNDYFGLFFVIFSVFIFSNIAKNIEIRFGTRFFITIYLFSAVMSMIFYLLIRFLLLPFYPISLFNAVPVGFAMAGIFGLIAYVIFLNPNREMLLLCLFVPVKMKAKSLLLILILPYLILGLLWGLLESYLYFAIYFPVLGGVLASYSMFYLKDSRR